MLLHQVFEAPTRNSTHASGLKPVLLRFPLSAGTDKSFYNIPWGSMRFYAHDPHQLLKILNVQSCRAIFRFFLGGSTLLRLYTMSQSLRSYLRIDTFSSFAPILCASSNSWRNTSIIASVQTRSLLLLGRFFLGGILRVHVVGFIDRYSWYPVARGRYYLPGTTSGSTYNNYSWFLQWGAAATATRLPD